jgi:hypothetical protein
VGRERGKENKGRERKISFVQVFALKIGARFYKLYQNRLDLTRLKPRLISEKGVNAEMPWLVE